MNRHSPSSPSTISRLNIMRSASSPSLIISQDSSEFEFVFSVAFNEPPVSPKLVNPTLSPHWEISAASSSGIILEASITHDPSSVECLHVVPGPIATMGGGPHALPIHDIVDADCGDGVMSSVQAIPDVGLSSSSNIIHKKHDIINKETDISFTEAASGSSIILCGDVTDQNASFDADHTRRMSPSRSLMLAERRDLEHELPPPPLASNPSPSAHECSPQTLMQSSLLSKSSSTSSLYSYNVSDSVCSISSNSPSSSPPAKKSNHMKKWPFKMAFLNKARSVNKGPHYLKSVHELNHDLSSGHFKDRVHVPSREMNYMKSTDSPSSDVGCLQYNSMMNEFRDNIVNEPDAEAIELHGEESVIIRRQSTCSSTSSRSISLIRSAALKVSGDGEVIRGANHRINKCASAPVSHAGSPSRVLQPALPTSKGAAGTISLKAGAARAPATGSTSASVNRPMSPHEQHYQQQRARAEDLRRRTFLPYRQSLLSACFFHSAPPQPQVLC